MVFIMNKFYFKLLIVAICLSQSFIFQTKAAPDTLSVTAGNLKTVLGINKDFISNLALKGEINGNDIATIRSMARLCTLSLKNVDIVEGGSFTVYETPISVTRNVVPANMFTRMSNLISVDLPQKAVSLGDNAFYFCAGLISVNLGDSIKSIGDGAFSACGELSFISLPTHLTSLGTSAFMTCSSLKSITLPESLTTIGETAFWSCKELKAIAIPGNVTSIGKDAFCGCSSMTSISIANGLPSIGEGAFRACPVTSVTIPNSVKTIGKRAFADCTSLTKMILGSGVTTIEDYAFDACSALNEIHCKALIPPTGIYGFSNVQENTCKLYVPKGTVTSYKNAFLWAGFANTIEESSSTPVSPVQSSNLEVHTEQDNIVLSGVEPGEMVSVYTEAGTLLQKIKATDHTVRIKASALPHFYILKTTHKTLKMIL
jgi:hypothetical protein